MIHAIYLTIIFVLYILAGDMISTFVFATNELAKSGGTLRGKKIVVLKDTEKHSNIARFVWPVIAFCGMFFPPKPKQG